VRPTDEQLMNVMLGISTEHYHDTARHNAVKEIRQLYEPVYEPLEVMFQDFAVHEKLLHYINPRIKYITSSADTDNEEFVEIEGYSISSDRNVHHKLIVWNDGAVFYECDNYDSNIDNIFGFVDLIRSLGYNLH